MNTYKLAADVLLQDADTRTQRLADMLTVLHALLGYAESRTQDGGKRPLFHMAAARNYLGLTPVSR